MAHVARWAEGSERVRCITGRFGRRTNVRGLLSPVEWRNGWQLTKQAEDASLVRDDLREYMAEHLGASDGVLVVDETPEAATEDVGED